MSAIAAVEDRSDDLSPAELQAAARDAYRRAVADGHTPTGAELSGWFDRSERWGRDRIAECRHVPDGNATAAIDSAALLAGSRPELVPVITDPNGMGPAEPSAGDGNEDLRPAEQRQPSKDGSSRSTIAQEVMWSRRVIRWVTTAAVIVVAACAARSSYEHQRTVVEMAGNPEAAWYLPLSVDGMMLIASLNMLVRRWDNQPAGSLTWTALLLGGAASLAANIAAAPPTLIGRIVAAWSPICLIVSYELLMQQLPSRAPAADPEGRQP